MASRCAKVSMLISVVLRLAIDKVDRQKHSKCLLKLVKRPIKIILNVQRWKMSDLTTTSSSHIETISYRLNNSKLVVYITISFCSETQQLFCAKKN